MDILFAQDPAGGILRRIEDNEPGAIADQRGQFVHIEAEIFLLPQAEGHCPRPGIVNHRLVNREAGIGKYDFIPRIGQSQQSKKNNRLAPGDDHYFFARDPYSARAGDVLRNGLAQLGQAGRGAVVGPALAQGADSSFNHVGRSVEIGLANFQVDNLLTQTLQCPRLVQDFKGSLSPEPRHALSQSKFVLRSFFHSEAKHSIISRQEHAASACVALASSPTAFEVKIKPRGRGRPGHTWATVTSSSG